MKNSTGFTLIEVIAAMAIIAIGLISLLSLFPTGIATNQLAAATSEGTILCKSMMQEIKKAATSTWDKDPSHLVLLGDEDGSEQHTLRFDGDEWCSFGKYIEPDDDDARQVFPDNDLYEVSVKFDDEYGPFDQDDGIARVVVTAYWPLAGGDSDTKDKQRSVKLVSFIRYNKP